MSGLCTRLSQVEKEKLRQSKAYKGFRLLVSPRLKPVERASASVISAKTAPTLPNVDPALKRIAENKHLLSLPPHLQAELNALREAKKLADAVVGPRKKFYDLPPKSAPEK